MKFFLALSLALTTFFATPGFSQDNTDAADAAVAEPFSGKIVFHQSYWPVVYEITVANGQVSGVQHMADDPKPIAKIVGGWFDFKKGQLSLLIQSTSDDIDSKYQSQCQQFQIDRDSKKVTLEHMLYSYGLTEQDGVATAHVLDSFDAVQHLVKSE